MRNVFSLFFAIVIFTIFTGCGNESRPGTDALAARKSDAQTVSVGTNTTPDTAPPTERQPDAATTAPDIYADATTPVVDTASDFAKLDSKPPNDAPVMVTDTPLTNDLRSEHADAPTTNPDTSPDRQIDTVSVDSQDAGCILGLIRTSYSGSAKTSGIGICLTRIEKCELSGVYVTEHEEVLPTAEIPWDGIDQDCDGTDLMCPVYVSADAVDTGSETGAPTSPWRTIQSAINHTTNCDTITVKRGTYTEQVYFQSSNIKVIKSEEGPSVTIIDRNGSTDEPSGIILEQGPITIEGFTIANAAGNGINVESVPYTTIIQHNIFLHNKTGINVSYGPGNGEPVIIRNNIIIGNPNKTTGAYDGTGIRLRQRSGVRRVENNLIIQSQGTSSTSSGVFIDNWSTGFVQNNIIAGNYNGILRYYDYNTTTSQYNCLFGNSYNYVKYEPAGLGDVTTDPKIMSPISGDIAATADFHLSADSPCRNAGNPDPAYNNPDGTRNDIGPYGGPFGKW